MCKKWGNTGLGAILRATLPFPLVLRLCFASFLGFILCACWAYWTSTLCFYSKCFTWSQILDMMKWNVKRSPPHNGFSEVHLTWLSAGKTPFSLKHSRTCEYANSFQITSLAAWHKMSSRKISAYVQWRLEVFNITAGWILDQDCLPNYLWSHKWCL